MKVLLVSTAVAAVVLTSCSAGLADSGMELIHFDTLAQDIFISDEYIHMGIRFVGGNFQVRDNAGGGKILKPSPPSMLAVNAGVGLITFVDPLDPSLPATIDHVQFDNPGLIAGTGVFYAGLTVTAVSMDGGSLAVATIDPLGPNEARPISTTTFDMPGIHSLRIERIENPVAPAFVAIDNLMFTPVPSHWGPGDANHDGLVDLQDFGALKDNYAQSGVWEQGDFNGDGLIGLQDFGILKDHYSPAAPPAGVPEPASLSLLAMAGVVMVTRKR